MMHLIEGTIVQLVYFMRLIRDLFGIGCVWVCLVFWNFDVGR